jgi:hypothetical protein
MGTRARLGVTYLACGVFLAAVGAMGVSQYAAGRTLTTTQLTITGGVGLVGLLLCATGWALLRRAPREDLVSAGAALRSYGPALAVASVMPVAMALLPETAQQSLARAMHDLHTTLHDVYSLLHAAKGGP